MGKSSTPKVEVTEFYMSQHFGACAGPVDALKRVIVKEKTVWEGRLTALTSVLVQEDNLFGGATKEGGATGTITYLPGDEDQLLPDDLALRLGRPSGASCPGYRGLTSVFFTGRADANEGSRGFYWSANSPYLPGVWLELERAPVGLDPAYAMIPASGSTTSLGEFAPFAVVDIDAISDASVTKAGGLAVGTTLTGLLPTDVLRFTMPGGGTYTAWNWLHGWVNEFDVIKDGDPGQSFRVNELGVTTSNSGHTTNHGSAAAAQAAFGTQTITGASSYHFYIFDTPISDNAGGVSVTVERAPTIFSDADANPAHIIFECLTNTDWGMGSPDTAIDVASFEAAAVTLWGEAFGLSMIWTRQSSIQDFIQEVLDHILAVLFVDPATGLLTLKLIRGDYDADALDEINPSNADLSSFGRKLWGEIVNEVVVTWTNPENEQDETVTVQDLASIVTQGGIISDGRNYYGVRNSALAQRLAQRDLRSAGAPLASCEAEVDRTLWQVRPASVYRLTWPEYGLAGVVMRVTDVNYGRPGDPTIKLTLVEDVFGLDVGDYVEPPSTIWEDPSQAPTPVDEVQIFTLPLFMAMDTTVSAFVTSPDYPEVLAGVLATTSNPDAFSYQLWDEVALPDGSLEWQQIGTNTIIGRGELVDAIDAEAETTLPDLDNFTGLTQPSQGGFAIIGDGTEEEVEIALITAVGASTILSRGVLDTVPKAWPAGTPVWFVNGSTLYEDPLVRSSAEEVSYKLLPQTSLGVLDLASAPLETATLTDRPWLPNRPANVQIGGVFFNSATDPVDMIGRPDPWVTVSWANRNRLMEDSQVLGWTDASVPAEDGQTTTVTVYAADGTTELATHTGLSGTTFDIPDASFVGAALVLVVVAAERTDADGTFASLQGHGIWVQIEAPTFDSTAVTFDSTDWTMDAA